MNFIKISENIYFLKGNRSSNIFFFDFGKKALIDTGHRDDCEYNIAALEKNGICTDKIDYILNTHSHGDHVGGNSIIKSKNPYIKIACSIYKEEYQNDRASTMFMKNVEDEYDEFKTDIELKDGDIIDLDGCVLEVIETKGHSRDSISFFEKNNKFLFSGDTIYNRVITQIDYYQEFEKSIEDLSITYDRIKKIDSSIIYTGHGDPLTDVSANLKYCIKKLERFRSNPEMVLINNFIPALEFFIYKNDGCRKSVLKDEILNNMLDYSEIKFLSSFDKKKHESVFDKMYSLMGLLGYFNEKDGYIFLNRKPNEYLNTR